MKLVLLTGASRGFGLALAQRLAPDHQVVNLSRTAPAIEVPSLQTHLVDLSELEKIPEVIAALFSSVKLQDYTEICLINNAGMLTPIKLVGTLPADELEKNLRVNLLAPLLLTNAFLRATSDFSGMITVANISSGVVENPKPGWSGYGAAKAGLENFTQTLVRENISKKNFRALSFNPGVMDTVMQNEIRAASSNDFPEVERFRGLKAQGQLTPPEKVAKVLVDLLATPGPFSKSTFHYRDLIATKVVAGSQ